MITDPVSVTAWTDAHETMLKRMIAGLNAIGAVYRIQVNGESYGELPATIEKVRSKVNDFVAKYDYISLIDAFDGGTLFIEAQPGEAEGLRGVMCTALSRKFDKNDYATNVRGDTVTVIAHSPKTSSTDLNLFQ